jgi:para-aminobenzoate synthetase component 2
MNTPAAARLLLIDNYDSFTYNLVQAFMVLGAEVLVHRNDRISVDEARALCLGHQSLVEVFGGKVVRAARLMHGKTSYVHHDGRGILAGLPEPFEAGRYHSLIAQPQSLPDVLEVAARTDEGEIMAVRHRDLAVEGVQFHPESVLTPQGPLLMDNFLQQRSPRRQQ